MKGKKEVRTIQIPVSESTYQKLVEVRGRRTWLEFLEDEVLYRQVKA